MAQSEPPRRPETWLIAEPATVTEFHVPLDVVDRPEAAALDLAAAHLAEHPERVAVVSVSVSYLAGCDEAAGTLMLSLITQTVGESDG